MNISRLTAKRIEPSNSKSRRAGCAGGTGMGTGRIHEKGTALSAAPHRLARGDLVPRARVDDADEPRAGWSASAGPRRSRPRPDVGVRHAIGDGVHHVIRAVAAAEQLELLFDVHRELARQTGVLAGKSGAIGRMACRAGRHVAFGQTASPDLLTQINQLLLASRGGLLERLLRQVQRDVLHVGRRQVLRHGGHGVGLPPAPLRTGSLAPCLTWKSVSCLTRYSWGCAARLGFTGMVLLPAAP